MEDFRDAFLRLAEDFRRLAETTASDNVGSARVADVAAVAAQTFRRAVDAGCVDWWQEDTEWPSSPHMSDDLTPQWRQVWVVVVQVAGYQFPDELPPNASAAEWDTVATESAGRLAYGRSSRSDWQRRGWKYGRVCEWLAGRTPEPLKPEWSRPLRKSDWDKILCMSSRQRAKQCRRGGRLREYVHPEYLTDDGLTTSKALVLDLRRLSDREREKYDQVASMNPA